MRVVSVSWKSLTRSGVSAGAAGAAVTEAAPTVATTMAAIAAAPGTPLIPALPSSGPFAPAYHSFEAGRSTEHGRFDVPALRQRRAPDQLTISSRMVLRALQNNQAQGK